MDCRDTFLTTSYRGEFIHSCCNRTTGQEEVKAFVGGRKLVGTSVPHMRRRVRAVLEAARG